MTWRSLIAAALGLSLYAAAGAVSAHDPRLCAAYDRTWAQAAASGSLARMQAVAATIPSRCSVWSIARDEIRRRRSPANRSGASNPGFHPGPSPQHPVDPMSGIPASHRSGAQPPG